jgi:oligopeptide/dipeptide ABC transporter ATP-binding protein
MTEPLLSVRNLETSFFSARGVVRAVDDVSLHVNPGEAVGLIGESGSGKSITAASIARLVPPPGRTVGGSVTFKGRDMLALSQSELQTLRRHDIGMIFQDAGASLNPVMTVGDQIIEATTGRGERSKDDHRRAIEALAAVRIADPARVASSYPHELSGGMRQRVMIAAALIRKPTLIIADEPTTALDATVQAGVLKLLAELQATHNAAMLFISHDLAVIADLCQRVYIMYAGQIVEEGPTREVFANPGHPYTRALLDSILDPWEPAPAITALKGDPPNMASPPSGCRFHPRCPRVFEPCPDRMPTLAPTAPGRAARCWLHAAATEDVTAEAEPA